jgi:hypothetical protein
VPYKNPNNYVKYSGRLAEALAQVSITILHKWPEYGGCPTFSKSSTEQPYAVDTRELSRWYFLQTHPGGAIWGNQVLSILEGIYWFELFVCGWK